MVGNFFLDYLPWTLAILFASAFCCWGRAGCVALLRRLEMESRGWILADGMFVTNHVCYFCDSFIWPWQFQVSMPGCLPAHLSCRRAWFSSHGE